MAGGQVAGRLEIEIVAEIAKLQADMRQVEREVGKMADGVGRKTKAVNDNLRSMGQGSGAGMQEFSREVANLKAKLDPAWSATQRYKAEVDLLRKALDQGAISVKQFAAASESARQALSASRRPIQDVTQQTGAMRAGFQNVGFQLSDFAVQVGGGTSAIRAASQQAPQLIQALAMMGAGAGDTKGKFAAFTTFLGGPWGAALTVAVSILGALASAYLTSAGASDTKKDATKDLTDAMNDLHAATVREAQSTWASIQVDIDKANSLRLRAVEARKAAIAELELAKARAEGAKQSISPGAPGYSNAFNLGEQAKQEANARAIEKQIAAQQKLVQQGNETIRLQRGKQTQLEVAAQFDKNAAATLRYDKSLDGLNSRLQAGKITQAQYRSELVAITTAREAAQASDNKRERTGRSRVTAISAEAKAIAQQTKETERFIEALQEEIAKIGLDEKALRQLEIAKQLEAAQTDKQRKAIAGLNADREKALALQEAEKVATANKDYAKKTAQMERELGLIGLTGVAREKMTLALAEQAEIEAVLIKLQKAEMDGNVALIAQLEEEIRLIRERYGVVSKGVDMADDAARTAENLKLANDQLRDMIGLLGGLGKVGSAIGGLLGIFTGNTSAVGGPIGDLLNAQIGTQEKDGKIVARTIGDEISKVFDKSSDFGKAMGGLSEILQGAGTGLIAGNAVFGKQTGTEKIGSAIGGAIGKSLGKDLLTKPLESLFKGLGGAAGPLGAIAGGLIGSVVGGLFTSTKWGRTILSAGGASAGQGNNSASERAAVKAGGGFMTALQSIVDQFGGTLNDFGNIALGVRHGDWRVNTGGTSLKIKKGAVEFDGDAEAAIQFAIMEAIKRGAVGGVRAGTQRLLQLTDDLQANLTKAMQFEDVFKQLKAQTDPLGFALDGIATKFDALRKIFDEAGASAAEYAQLAQLQALETAAAQESAAQQAIRDFQERADLQVRILQLQGKEEEALALARESELKGVKDALKPLQQMIYRLEDARAIMDQFKPLADSLREFRQELMGSRSTDTFGAVQGRYQATAASAANGDAAAMARLQQDATAYLDAARDNASSAIDYQRAVGEVLGSVDRAIFSADNQVAMAQAQINATMETNNSVNRVRDEVRAMREKSREQNERMEKIWKRFEGDGIPLRSDTTNPLAVVVV